MNKDSMTFNYIVSGTEASQDGGPFVYVTYSTPDYFKEGSNRNPPECPFGLNTTTITSPEDLMKNLPKAMANINKVTDGDDFPTDSPTFKISMREYEDMAIRIGDKVTIEIKKTKNS